MPQPVDNQNGLYRNPNLQIIFGVTLMAVMGVSIITPALPRIQAEFQIDMQAVGLLISAFTLPGVFLAAFIGVLADRLGRKKLLVPSLFLFALAGVGCGLSQSFGMLVAFTALQGVGAAGLGSLNMTLIGDVFAGRQRAEAMGLNAAVLSVGTAMYPAIGGLLALPSWRYPYFVSVAAIPVGLSVLFYLRNPEPQVCEALRQYFALAARHLRSWKLAGLFGAGVLTFILLYGGYLVYFSFLIANKFGGSTLVTGLILSSSSVTTAFVSSQLGRVTRWVPETTLVKLGLIFYAAGLVAIPLIPSLPLLVLAGVLFGIGHGINIPSLTTAIAGLAPFECRGAIMSVNSTILRLGQTLGPVLAGAVFAFSGSDLTATFWVFAVIALAGAAVGFGGGRALAGGGEKSPD